MIYVTQQVRHALAGCLASRLATCSHSSVAETAERANVMHKGFDEASTGGGEVGGAVKDVLPEMLASLREEMKRKSFLSQRELQVLSTTNIHCFRSVLAID